MSLPRSWYESMRLYCAKQVELSEATLMFVAILASEVDELSRSREVWFEILWDFKSAVESWNDLSPEQHVNLREMAFEIGAAADFAKGLGF